MAVQAEAFLAIEGGLTERLQRTWNTLSTDILAAVRTAIRTEDWPAAVAAAKTIDLSPIFEANREYIRYSLYSGMLYGATRLTDDPDHTTIVEGRFDHVIDKLSAQMKHSILGPMQERVREELEEEVRAAEESARADAAAVVKFDPDQPRDEQGQWTTTGATEAREKVRGLDALQRYGTDPADQKEAHFDMAALYDDWYKSTDAMEKDAIEFYQGAGYVSMNSLLRHGYIPPGGIGSEAFTRSAVKEMDEALDRAGGTPEEITLYRGMSVPMGERLQVGEEFTDKGFVSASLSPTVGASFSTDPYKTVMRVTVPKGSRGAYLDAPVKQGATAEVEFLLGSGTRFKVDSIEEGVEISRTTLGGSKIKAKVYNIRVVAQETRGLDFTTKSHQVDITTDSSNNRFVAARDDVEFHGKKTKKAERPLVQPLTSFRDTGDALLQIMSSLNTSRVASFGFTSEAQVLGIKRYSVSEQLDIRTCPVCREMHGRTFEVQDARESLDDIIGTDPEGLEEVQPWPGQDRASLEELVTLSDDELVERNWHIPPYHPNCRGILVPEGKESPLRPEEDAESAFPVPSDQYLATLESFREFGLGADAETLDIWNTLVGVEVGAVLAGFLGKEPAQILEEVFNPVTGASRASRAGVEHFDVGDEGTVNMKIAAAGIYGAGSAIGAEFGFNVGNGTMNVGALTMSEADAENGTLETILASWAPTWNRLGIEQVSLLAGSDLGGLAWAKYGFTPERDEWDALRARLEKKLDPSDTSTAAEAARKVLAQKDVKGIWAIADLTIGESLLAGEEWAATLDLTDIEAKNRLRVLLTDRVVKAEWDESQHPRADDGKFTDGGGASAAVDKASAHARDYVTGKSNSATHEHGIAFGPGGEAIGTWEGTEENIILGEDDARKIMDNGTTFYHNHPDQGPSLSDADINMAASMGLASMNAVSALDGTVFSVRARNLPSQVEGDDKKAVQKAYDRLRKRYDTTHEKARGNAAQLIYHVMNIVHERGDLSTQDWNRTYDHLINVAMHKTGFIDYSTSQEGKSFQGALERLGKHVNTDNLTDDAAKYAGEKFTKKDRKDLFVEKSRG